MGNFKHHIIVVSASYSKGEEGHWSEVAHTEACKVFGCEAVTPVLASDWNNLRTFMVVPDGSKEFWQESDNGDARRQEFIDWLEAQKYDDGGSPLDWAECFYGQTGQDRSAGIERHS